MGVYCEDFAEHVQVFVKTQKINTCDLTETWESIEKINRLKIKDMLHLQNLCTRVVVDVETKQTSGYIVGYMRNDDKIILLDGNHRAAFYIVKGFKKIPIVLLKYAEE